MENKKTKKKFTLKKIKRILINIIRKIANSIKSLYKQFMSLPNHIRKIIYVWSIIIILLILLAFLSTNNTQYLNKYAEIESEMNKSALDYVKSNKIIPGEENKLRLDLNVLLDFDYIYKDVITDPTCEGFSLIYFSEKDDDYVIRSYLKCAKYTTKGYSDYK